MPISTTSGKNSSFEESVRFCLIKCSEVLKSNLTKIEEDELEQILDSEEFHNYLKTKSPTRYKKWLKNREQNNGNIDVHS